MGLSTVRHVSTAKFPLYDSIVTGSSNALSRIFDASFMAQSKLRSAAEDIFRQRLANICGATTQKGEPHSVWSVEVEGRLGIQFMCCVRVGAPPLQQGSSRRRDHARTTIRYLGAKRTYFVWICSNSGAFDC